MPVKFTQAVLATLKPRAKPYDLTDSDQKGLVLRVRPSGTHSWLVRLGHGRWLVLGRLEDLTPLAARKRAHTLIENDRCGQDPIAAKRRAREEAEADRQQQASDAMTFDKFLTEKYGPYARAHLKSLQSTVRTLELQFSPRFGDQPLTAITAEAVEEWRTARLNEERRAPYTPNRPTGTRLPGRRVLPVTINKELSALKSALQKAVEWKLLGTHPIKGVKLLRQDRRGGIVRFLTADERARLFGALAARDDKRRAARERANEWRRARGYELLADYGGFTDHVTPVVILALNSGCRRSELLKLTWGNVDLDGQLLSVRGSTSKSGQSRHIPLTTQATDTLKAWRPEDRSSTALVFPHGEDGNDPMFSLKSVWRTLMKSAKIENFRLHDTRHDYASRLVQAGVSLYEVQKLLGHSSIELTERYSHLAGENLRAAVAKLEARSD